MVLVERVCGMHKSAVLYKDFKGVWVVPFMWITEFLGLCPQNTIMVIPHNIIILSPQKHCKVDADKTIVVDKDQGNF